MPKKAVTQDKLKKLQTLWQYHIPPKAIAKALQLQYPTVTMYCRGFRIAGLKQLTEKQVAQDILNIKAPGQWEVKQ